MAKVRIKDVKQGDLVIHQGKLCLNALRPGKAASTHYLVPLEDPAAEITLIYRDPEDITQLAPRGTKLVLGTSESFNGVPDLGVAFVNDHGTFLKVLDADSHLRPFAYVNMETAEIQARQERKITAKVAWTVERRKKLLGLF